MGGIYRYTPLSGDTGEFAVHIVAADAAQAMDTLVISLIVRPLVIDSLPPMIKLFTPNKDSVSVNAASYKIQIVCFDQSNISSVKCFMGADSFPVEHTDSIYSAIVTGLAANVYNPVTFIAVDGSSRANDTSKTIYIKNDPGLQDSTGPLLRRSIPNKDSISTDIDSMNIQIIAIDQSGVASVECRLGSKALAVKKTDSVYTAVIKGLAINQVNRVDFIATDSSTNKNKDSLSFFITYVPAMQDSVKPTMRLNSPKNDSTKVGSSTVKVEIVAKDASGIESVRCSFKDADVAVSVSDSIYSATIAGLAANQFNKIRFIAADASSNGNRETLFVTVKYDPTMTDNVKPAMRRLTPATDSTSISSSSTTIPSPSTAVAVIGLRASASSSSSPTLTAVAAQ